jgi:short-subunit dehydrogenase
MKATEARVVITGATGAIGIASAEALVRAGAAVMLVGRSAHSLKQLESDLLMTTSARAGRVTFEVADLLIAADIHRLRINATSWGCNVLIHNAELASSGRLLNETPTHIQKAIQTNLVAPMLLTHGLLPHLLTQRSAQIICVGSTMGAIGLPGFSVYSATKFGLRGFAQALRRELIETNVNVQYFGPRAKRTLSCVDADAAKRSAPKIASDSPMQVAAELVALLQSGEAERFVGYPEKLAAHLNGLAPSLLDGTIKRHNRYDSDHTGVHQLHTWKY